jgi:DNA-binding transcriptional ArsR family regulator
MATNKTYQQPKLEKVSLSTAMQALADPCRIAIVRAMLNRPDHEFACNEFEFDLSKATISHHFETLRDAGIIQTRGDGRKCLSSLRQTSFEKRFPGLLDLVLRETVS